MQSIATMPSALLAAKAATKADLSKTNPAAKSMAKIDAVAQEFEATFLSEMLNHMFSGIDTNGPFFGGQGEETFRGFLVEEYGKSIAASGGIGIADAVKRQLLSLQEIDPS